VSTAIIFGVGVVVSLLVAAYAVLLTLASREDQKRPGP
jgi:hypothetical protein